MKAAACLLLVGLWSFGLFAGGVLRDGERYFYDLSYGKGICSVGAGTAELSVCATNVPSTDAFALTLAFSAASVVETFYHLRTRATSVVTPDLRVLRYMKHAEEGSRVYDEESVFFCLPTGTHGVASTRTHVGEPVEKGFSTRREPIYDLVSVLFYARKIDLSRCTPGTRFSVPVATGVRVAENELNYLGVEEVKTGDGVVRDGHVFLLRTPRRKSAEKNTVRFWLSGDGRGVPLRFDSDLAFGTVSACLKTLPD